MRGLVRVGMMLGLAAGVWAQGSVSGVVVDLTDAPIARVPVRLTKPGTSEAWVTQADQEGRFEFKELTAGSYEVASEAVGFYTSHALFELYEGETKVLPHVPLFVGYIARCEDVHVRLRPGAGLGSWVSGRLLERQSKNVPPRPLEGVDVQGDTTRGKTAPDGSFRLRTSGPRGVTIGEWIQDPVSRKLGRGVGSDHRASGRVHGRELQSDRPRHLRSPVVHHCRCGWAAGVRAR